MTVAALYVDPAGVYANLPGVEVWDEARDARTYAGPWPVVAHPPCQRWSIMGLCRPEYARGDDGGCFAAALAAVRTFGGVLEHPRHTLAWRAFALPRPAGAGWTRAMFDDGWTCEVDQSRYGLSFHKPTWLYYIGPEPPPVDLLWHDCAHARRRTHGHGVNGYEVIRTPETFRDVLLAMARSAARPLDKEKGEHLGSPAAMQRSESYP